MNKRKDPTQLQFASLSGCLDRINSLLAKGANEAELGWTDIFYAIAYGDIGELEKMIGSGCELEHRDHWKRTPLLFSILVGDIKKTAMLLEAGADTRVVGHYHTPPLFYAIQKDNVDMLNWLIDNGFDLEPRNQSGNTPLIQASGNGAIKCVKVLVERGVDIFATADRFADDLPPDQAIHVASSVEIANILVDAGADLNDLNRETRIKMLGYQEGKELDITEEEYLKDRVREYGKSNPELAERPFWQAMVKCGYEPRQASEKFDPCPPWEHPVWSYHRFGMSITTMPDGRHIEIAGEQEDYCNPDFCIYNDVLVHDGKGNCYIYMYPREVFPPTDFHTATLVGKYIYIIGNLGYLEKPGYTQVFRLDTNTMKMEKIETNGEMPGWICEHKAYYDGKSRIVIKGGKVFIDSNGGHARVDNKHEYSLCLDTMQWTKSG